MGSGLSGLRTGTRKEADHRISLLNGNARQTAENAFVMRSAAACCDCGSTWL